ncbi:phosphatase PAP2 family protein [Edaphobacter paludis]|uniref:Phosphatase PAP2 family protein n=1 Tax=Edaphobacter paludis TaxID=3035702 RepID=A0AAU7CVF5_9BACT
MFTIAALLCCFGLPNGAIAQGASGSGSQQEFHGSTSALPDAPQPNSDEKATVTLQGTPLSILKDQAAIWTSPARIREGDLVWLVPLAAATGVGIATDHHAMASVVTHDAGFNNTSVNASNVLFGGFIAAPVALYGMGYLKGNEHARETGLLSGEALVDGLVVDEAMKLVFRRERPLINNARGHFFDGSVSDSSFPSTHSVLAWSSAAVMAGEYPSRWAQVGIYTMATGVSLTRVMGQEHFPTDVLVGSAAGWLIGHYIFRAHHRHGLLQSH